MKTSSYLTQSRYWVWVLLVCCGLLLGAIAYPVFDASPSDPYAELPALAGPQLGGGGGPG